MPQPSNALINLFLVLHLTAVAMWSLPACRERPGCRDPMKFYMLSSGLWQGWDMFSPNPLATNFYLEAEITFRNGKKAVWKFPRMEHLDLVSRYQKERYRKWTERVRDDAFRAIWPDTARYIARLHANPENPPVLVSLTRRWVNIPPPIEGDDQPMPKRFEPRYHFTFFTYRVLPADLS